MVLEVYVDQYIDCIIWFLSPLEVTVVVHKLLTSMNDRAGLRWDIRIGI